jgi:hypothetical protein
MKDLRNEEIESTCHCELGSHFSKYGGKDHSNTKNTYANMDKELQSKDKYVCKRFKDC